MTLRSNLAVRNKNIALKNFGLNFLNLSIALLILLSASGAILMVDNVHTISVMGFTAYGSYLNFKLYLLVLIFCLIIFGIIKSKNILNYVDELNKDSSAEINSGYRALRIIQLVSMVMKLYR